MRLTENQLKRIIRNVLLVEGMKMPEQLGDEFRIEVVNSGYDRSIIRVKQNIFQKVRL